MTAAGGSGEANGMGTQEPGILPQAPPSGLRLARFGFRGRRKKKEGVIQGKLRIRSPPGAFLILGVMVVVVGTAVAVAGYWPYRAHRAGGAGGGASGANGTRVSAGGRGPGARSILSTSGLVHNDRMKLLGPIIMGVGLFIFICANTMLYENRDRETQQLLAQARSVICSMSAAVPPDDDLPPAPRDADFPCHYQWVTNLAPADLNIRCLEEAAGSEPLLLQVRAGEGKWAEGGGRPPAGTLLTKALHHQESSSPSMSLRSVHSDSCNSSQINFNVLTGSPLVERRVVSSTGALALPLIKLNNCLIEASPSSRGSWDAPALPRRSYSLSSRTNPREAQVGGAGQDPALAVAMATADRPTFLPEPLRKDYNSDVCLNMVGLADAWSPSPSGGVPVEERKHRSWPRLDLGSARRYLKLENKEDSVDRLLDQLEQQYSQWDKVCGSGPFQ
ncbi:transmembrane protein 200A-like [Megalops cyprinoides]|uniref:transmembrane protein 200A-like n=1 Tax=Megalops cyprinoides TaxID=118141 RepID=UPI0018645247|nr:transmembrane protein 200A-like [Megalops cyprinoides]